MSKIEWTEKTWNPIVGCRRVSAGCDNCYAILEAHRKGSQFEHYAGLTELRDGRIDWTAKFSVAPDHIFDKPLAIRKRTTWFVNSMSDLFGEGVTDETIKRVFAIMNATPQHRYQILTKRPNRAVKLAHDLDWTANIWMGVSIEDDRFVGRADLLRKIPAAIRFISAEPLLGGLPSLSLAEIDWIIAGGESGRSKDKVRPMAIEWARDLRDRAVDRGTAFFFKQWGNWDAAGIWHRAKHDAGRQLDGRTWDEQPEPRALTWSNVGQFRAALAIEHQDEDEPPTIGEQSPRLALREPIWRTLLDRGPMNAAALRALVLCDFGMDAASARAVNFHAWALVDLQNGGFVEQFKQDRVKMYRAVKPRVRVRAEAA
jgi:protein gp37